MLSYIPVILVVGIYVGKSVPRSSDQCVRVASLASAPICACAVCVRSGSRLAIRSGFALKGAAKI